MSVTVVIVDDDSGFRSAAAEILESLGAEVLARSADGATGIEAVLHHQPDWVLLDVNLPDRDGLSVAHALRSSASRVILTSAGDSGWSAEELARAGVERYVAKDQLFDPRMLELIFSR